MVIDILGRRIDTVTNCTIALPHDEVESSEFYKHIESEGTHGTTKNEAALNMVWDASNGRETIIYDGR